MVVGLSEYSPGRIQGGVKIGHGGVSSFVIPQTRWFQQQRICIAIILKHVGRRVTVVVFGSFLMSIFYVFFFKFLRTLLFWWILGDFFDDYVFQRNFTGSKFL